jgi:hypothetical protein
MPITFHPAFKAQLSVSTPGMIIADWSLDPIKWAVANKNFVNGIGQYYVYNSADGDWYFLAPLVPIKSAVCWTNITTAGSSTKYIAYTSNPTTSIHLACNCPPGTPPVCSGPLSFNDYNHAYEDFARVGFNSPDTLVNTIAITGTSRSLGYGSTGYGIYMDHNAGNYYQENRPSGAPRFYNYQYYGSRSELTKRSILMHTNIYDTSYEYEWGLDEYNCHITDIRTLSYSIRSGVNTLTLRNAYSMSREYYEYDANPLHGEKSQSGTYISQLACDIYYMPTSASIVNQLQGRRFTNIGSYGVYNTTASVNSEVAFIVLNHHVAEFDIGPGFGSAFPFPWISTPATQTKSYYYAMAKGSEYPEQFVDRLVSITDLFEGAYTYLPGMYVAVKGYPLADPIDDNPDTLPDPGGDPQEITFRYETYKAIRSGRELKGL